LIVGRGADVRDQESFFFSLERRRIWPTGDWLGFFLVSKAMVMLNHTPLLFLDRRRVLEGRGVYKVHLRSEGSQTTPASVRHGQRSAKHAAAFGIIIIVVAAQAGRRNQALLHGR
jgi:hypothetical protein